MSGETLRAAMGLTLFGLAAVPLAAGGANAAAPNVPPQATGQQLAGIETQRQALFKQMLADPGNVDLALRYAALSSQAGDLEGAISTLERLLIFAPDLSRLNFELGVLYFRLGATDLASTYFRTARAAADATPDMQAEIDAYLAAADRQSSGDGTAGTVQLGARYQTNANGGAGNPWVDLNGVEFLLNPAAQADPDSNGFVTGGVHYSHDLAAQGDRFDVDLGGYGSLYGKHGELDTTAGEAQFGPVFNLERFSLAHSMLGFYGIFGGIGLKGDPYVYTAGAGTVLTLDPDPATEARARLEYRYEDYFNSVTRPSVSDMTGSRLRATGDIRHQLNDWAAFYGSVYGERKLAVLGSDADWEAGAVLGAVIRFSGPVLNRAGPWSLDVSAGVLQRRFDAADPMISSAPRRDREAFVEGALTVPLAASWSLVGTLGYRKVMSTYDLYSYDNLSTSLAMMKNF